MDIRSLATHLNLSIGTVSRALNGRKDVSEATRTRVIEMARKLGYTPNQAGQSLRRKRTGTAAFLLPVGPDSMTYGDPFFLSILNGVQTVLDENGLELVVLLWRIEQNPLEVLERHLRRGIADGWILAATQSQDTRIALLLAQDTPFVTLGRSETAGIYPSIDLDFEDMVDTVMARFLAAGHQRIALITSGPGVNFSHLVTARYKAALQGARLPFDPDLLYAGSDSAQQCAQVTTAMLALDRPPTAIFVMGENGAVGAYASLRACGLEPGRDIAIVGFRHTAACAALQPALSCFSVPVRGIGEDLARALVRQMKEGPQDEAIAPALWKMTWVEGESD